jgi:hypothetical protein
VRREEGEVRREKFLDRGGGCYGIFFESLALLGAAGNYCGGDDFGEKEAEE